MSEDELYDLYVNQHWSTLRIATLANCNAQTITNHLKSSGVSIRGRGSYKGSKSPEHTEKLKQQISKYSNGLFGSDHPAWKGGRYIDSYGYAIIRRNQKNVKEHRWIMEQHLGRKLEPWQEVHHKNKNKSDNRIENLEVYESYHKKADYKLTLK